MPPVVLRAFDRIEIEEQLAITGAASPAAAEKAALATRVKRDVERVDIVRTVAHEGIVVGVRPQRCPATGVGSRRTTPAHRRARRVDRCASRRSERVDGEGFGVRAQRCRTRCREPRAPA